METDTNNAPQATKCLNCDTEFQGKYCPECGQSAETRRFTMNLVFEHLIEALWGVDGSIGFSLKSLFTHPGKMTLDYIKGKRTQYFSPISMLLIALTLYVLILSFTDTFIILDSISGQSYEAIPTGASFMERINHDMDYFFKNCVSFFYNNYTLCYLLLIPLYVVAARVCFGKNNRKRYNLAEYTIAMIYPMVIVVLFRCVIKLIYPLLPELSVLTGALITPIIMFLSVSACFSEMMRFTKAKTVWKGFLTVALYHLMSLGIILICVFILALIMALRYQ